MPRAAPVLLALLAALACGAPRTVVTARSLVDVRGRSRTRLAVGAEQPSGTPAGPP